MYTNSVNPNLNFTSAFISKRINKSCEILGKRIDVEPMPFVKISREASLYTKRLSSDKDLSGLLLSVKKGKNEASVYVIQDKMSNIKEALLENTRKTAKLVEEAMERLKSALTKAALDEPKSLDEFI